MPKTADSTEHYIYIYIHIYYTYNIYVYIHTHIFPYTYPKEINSNNECGIIITVQFKKIVIKAT